MRGREAERPGQASHMSVGIDSNHCGLLLKGVAATICTLHAAQNGAVGYVIEVLAPDLMGLARGPGCARPGVGGRPVHGAAGQALDLRMA